MDCPICLVNQKDLEYIQGRDPIRVSCPRCGQFAITKEAGHLLKGMAPHFGLSAWVRSQEGASQPPLLFDQDIERILTHLPRYTVSEKQLIFLRAIEKRSEFPGKKVAVTTEFDFTLAWLSTEEELCFIIRALMGRHLLELDKYSDPKDSFALELTITHRGWEFLEQHGRPAQFSNQGFVAMAFADEMQAAWTEGIAPGVLAAGFQPYRIDVKPHIDRIDTKIITEIKNSRFLVADVTLQRQGVYFEAGYALGLGLPVFWSVRKDELAKVHFDTRQYNHIVWNSIEDLRDQLTLFVTSVVGRGAFSNAASSVLRV
jgi:nucleoside 2-deoxyribosyltransferase